MMWLYASTRNRTGAAIAIVYAPPVRASRPAPPSLRTATLDDAADKRLLAWLAARDGETC